jgi:hypothetical protein
MSDIPFSVKSFPQISTNTTSIDTINSNAAFKNQINTFTEDNSFNKVIKVFTGSSANATDTNICLMANAEDLGASVHSSKIILRRDTGNVTGGEILGGDNRTGGSGVQPGDLQQDELMAFNLINVNTRTRMISLSSTNSNSVGIKYAHPPKEFYVNGTAGGTVAWTPASDDRIKFNEIDISNSIDIIKQLKPQKYEKITSFKESSNWMPTDASWNEIKNKTDASGNRLWNYEEEIGLIAQDVKQIPDLSFCVTGEEINKYGNQTPLALNYNNIFCLMIKSIQELEERLTALENK